MSEQYNPRQQEILQAARQEFTNKGIAGARMEAIADNIGVTKAMIHYYFDTKENLFNAVFEQACNTLMSHLMEVLEERKSLFPKIEQFIDDVLDRFHQHPRLAVFVINELNRKNAETDRIFQESCTYNANIFVTQLKEAASNYIITPVEPEQVIGNILSLSVFSYSGQGFLAPLIGINDDEKYEQFLRIRREVIKDTIINWLAG